MGVFGKGKIEIQLNRLSFAQEEKIQGKVVLNLNEPVNAREVRIVLQAIRTNSMASKGQNRTQVLYEFKQVLDGQKQYMGTSEYAFELLVPSNIVPKMPVAGGALGAAIGVLGALSASTMRVDWYLDASLDIPMGFDVSRRVQIQVA